MQFVLYKKKLLLTLAMNFHERETSINEKQSRRQLNCSKLYIFFCR